MKEQSLYVGNIMQRTWYENEQKELYPAAEGNYMMFVKKEKAVLYKTKNGVYVDIDDLLKKADFRKVDKVEILDKAESSKNGITIMPAVALSEVGNETKSWGLDGTLGTFVDSESLTPYNELEKEENSLINRTR